jgi:hypothetical protein
VFTFGVYSASSGLVSFVAGSVRMGRQQSGPHLRSHEGNPLCGSSESPDPLGRKAFCHDKTLRAARSRCCWRNAAQGTVRTTLGWGLRGGGVRECAQGAALAKCLPSGGGALGDRGAPHTECADHFALGRAGRGASLPGLRQRLGNHRQPPSTTVNHRQPPSTTVNYRQPPSTPPLSARGCGCNGRCRGARRGRSGSRPRRGERARNAAGCKARC